MVNQFLLGISITLALTGCTFAQNSSAEQKSVAVEGKQIELDENGRFTRRTAPSPPPPVRKSDETASETAVFNESQNRIKKIIAQDLDAAYAYLSPASQIALPKLVYASRLLNRTLTNATVLRVECESDVLCKAKVQIFTPVRLKGVSNPIAHEAIVEEVWVKIDQNWRIAEGLK